MEAAGVYINILLPHMRRQHIITLLTLTLIHSERIYNLLIFGMLLSMFHTVLFPDVLCEEQPSTPVAGAVLRPAQHKLVA
jgi:hypothetical protein